MQLLIIETRLHLWHKITKCFEGYWSRIGVLEPLGAGVWFHKQVDSGHTERGNNLFHARSVESCQQNVGKKRKKKGKL